MDTTDLKEEARQFINDLGGRKTDKGHLVWTLLLALEAAEAQASAVPATGTVAALRKALEGLDGEMRVVLAIAAEGDAYRLLDEAEVTYHSPSTNTIVPNDIDERHKYPDSAPALVLWPSG